MKTLLFAALLGTLHLSAQSYQDLAWGKVSPEDLAMTSYPLDTTADAVVLADQGYMIVERAADGTFVWQLARHKRIKILTQAGINQYADGELVFYKQTTNDKLVFLDAQSISPSGEIVAVPKKEVFTQEINNVWNRAAFGFPNVKIGSVLEFRYIVRCTRVFSPDEWRFREEIPVRSSFFNFNCSAPIAYTYLFSGADYANKTEKPDGTTLFSLGDMVVTIGQNSFWMQNGDALRDEPYMTTMEDYRMKVRFQATEYTPLYGVTTPVYGTWEETAKTMLEDENLGEMYTKPRKSQNLLAAVNSEISAEMSQTEKINRITDFITRQIKWNEKLGIWAQATPDDAFERHEGSLPEIQYAGLSLLRNLGFQAFPVLISTRDNGEHIPSFPLLEQFNYVAIMVNVDDNWRLLDFSSQNLPLDYIRIEALNRLGYALSEDNPSWVNIYSHTFQDVVSSTAKLSADGVLTGSLKTASNGYSAFQDKIALNSQSAEALWTDRLPENIVLTDVTVGNQTDRNKPLTVAASFTLPDAGFVNDDFIYITPTLYSPFSENPFKLETRTFPIDFPFPFKDKGVFSIVLPENYVVESLPENTKIALPHEDATFSFLAQENDGKVLVSASFELKKTRYLPNEYPTLRDFFEQVAQKFQEQVVLKKVQ